MAFQSTFFFSEKIDSVIGFLSNITLFYEAPAWMAYLLRSYFQGSRLAKASGVESRGVGNSNPYGGLGLQMGNSDCKAKAKNRASGRCLPHSKDMAC